jgi:orotidine-5'-phosphate decarboxylase
MTPREAMNNGSNFIVIGRSITKESVNGTRAMQMKISQIIESLKS